TKPLASTTGLHDNLKSEFSYTSVVTGAAPLAFRDEVAHGCEEVCTTPVAFNFTVSITHALTLSVPRARTLHRSGHLTVGVHDPSGGPITDPAVHVELQLKGRSHWRKIGLAAV